MGENCTPTLALTERSVQIEGEEQTYSSEPTGRRFIFMETSANGMPEECRSKAAPTGMVRLLPTRTTRERERVSSFVDVLIVVIVVE